MERGTQRQISKKSGVSEGMLSHLLAGNKKAGWSTAKRLSQATGIDPVVFLEGTPEQIREALSRATKEAA